MQDRLQSTNALLAYRPDLTSHPLIAQQETARKKIRQSALDDPFEMGISRYYADLIQATNPLCPILQQCLPDPRELQDDFFKQADPLAEEIHMPVPGLTHRYPDRVLWYTTHNCAVYCRFCMRKRKVSRPDPSTNISQHQASLAYIKKNSDIKEVILSGGDPLSLSDHRLDFILTELRQIKHLHSIRIHSRMPVTLPERITEDLCQIFQNHYPLTLVTHFNHALEITEQAMTAIMHLKKAGLSVLNQSVLLKNINDSVKEQEHLLLALLRIGVIPYYLHRCDEVQGTSHLRVPLEKGVAILAALRGRNPGIALPRYIIDLPGGGGKIALEPDYIISRKNIQRNGQDIIEYKIKNYEGREFRVQD